MKRPDKPCLIVGGVYSDVVYLYLGGRDTIVVNLTNSRDVLLERVHYVPWYDDKVWFHIPVFDESER